MKKRILIIAILVIVIILITIFKNNIILCNSKEGKIILFYNENKVTNFAVYKMGYQIEEQNAYVEKIGIKEYIKNFKNWFEETTHGTCRIK